MNTFYFHHIGVAVKNIEKAKKKYSLLGYKPGKNISVPSQSVNVCFLEKADEPCIELIEPTSEKSPVNTMLKKVGSGPYHICYLVNNIQESLEYLKMQGFVILDKLVKSSAFNNNLMFFAYSPNFGYIEIINSEGVK